MDLDATIKGTNVRVGEIYFKNNFLYKDGTKRISDGAMVAITLMIAESNPSEKDIMVNLVMNLLTI